MNERENLRMTQAQLARRAGVATGTVSKAENGYPVRQSNLRKIILGLNKSLTWLDAFLNGDDEPAETPPVEATEVATLTDAEFDSFVAESIEMLPKMRKNFGDEFVATYVARLVQAATLRGKSVSDALRRAL